MSSYKLVYLRYICGQFALLVVEIVYAAARVAPSLPKPERPQRQGVRRESVENSLAAAAAKLSNMPVRCHL